MSQIGHTWSPDVEGYIFFVATLSASVSSLDVLGTLRDGGCFLGDPEDGGLLDAILFLEVPLAALWLRKFI